MATTRLGGWGGPRKPFGSFANKATAAAVALGGGRGRKKYPRRVLIGDRLFRVANAEEERRLLREYLASLKAKAERPQTEVARRKVLVKVRRTERRIESVDKRADEWLARLRAEDEEILLLAG